MLIVNKTITYRTVQTECNPVSVFQSIHQTTTIQQTDAQCVSPDRLVNSVLIKRMQLQTNEPLAKVATIFKRASAASQQRCRCPEVKIA